ncbi:hypothetical protein BEQ56_11940 [Anaerolineaceae bacterium oral taxon 439]|nr:hypothetical protein BEQ56_11940 [Anaerolineaceae bacterium oral taxon 439]
MHIEAYEWALYLSGQLSERRMSEMEAHLKECDVCLETYAALAAGEGAKPARFRFLRPFTRGRRPVFGAIAAVCVVLLIFLSTPTGKIVWAELTQSLREWFAIQSHPELVETLDVPAVSHHGVEMKLEEVLIEDNRVYFSVFVSAGKEITNFTHQIGIVQDGLTIGNQSFALNQEWWYQSQHLGYSDESDPKSRIMIILRADVAKEFLTDGEIPMKLQIDSISDYSDSPGTHLNGPWVFEFTVNGKKAKDLTRTVAIDRTFTGDRRTYTAVEMLFSPIRSRIRVQRFLKVEQFVGEIYGHKFWSSDSQGNLLGFVLQDGHGNRAEISRRDIDYTSEIEELQECVFYSDSENNGWEWLKDAESVTLTPYIVTLAGPQGNAPGIERFHALEPINVSLK